MKVIALKNQKYDDTSIKIGDVFDVLVCIKPVDTYELVLIRLKAGARSLRDSDTILYKDSDFYPQNNIRLIDFSKYCWLKMNTRNAKLDEVKLFEFTHNADATILLRKGF